MKRVLLPILALLAAGVVGTLEMATRSSNPVCSIDYAPGPARPDKAKGKDNMSSAASVSKVDFEQEVLKSDQPVLVDFWAPWCGPCRMLAPTVDELAADYEGRVKVVKVNVDENQDLASNYGIRGIPTLVVFKDGEPVDRIVGVKPKKDFEEKLDSALK